MSTLGNQIYYMNGSLSNAINYNTLSHSASIIVEVNHAVRGEWRWYSVTVRMYAFVFVLDL